MPSSVTDGYLPLAAAAERSHSDSTLSNSYSTPTSHMNGHGSGHSVSSHMNVHGSGHSNGHKDSDSGHTVSGHKVRYSLSINCAPEDLNLDKDSVADSNITFEVSSNHKRVSVDLTQVSAGGGDGSDDDYITSTLKVQRVRELEEKSQKSKLWKRLTIIALASVLGLILAFVPMLHEGEEDAQKCLGLVVFVAILWATEALPLWITSLSIPFFGVVGNIPVSDSETPESASVRAGVLLGDLMSPTVVLIFGGFSIAAALNKFTLDKRLAVVVLNYFGQTFRTLLIATMFLAAFFSMWVSNVAAPVMMVFLMAPVFPIISNANAKCLALGIAFSCNIGGMLTPIASPQNAVAEGYLEDLETPINFVEWLGGAVPVGFLGILITWAFLLFYYRPDNDAIPKLDVSDLQPFKWQHWYIVGVSALTVSLWCAFQGVQDVFGQLGVIALIPILLLFGANILTVEDLKAIDWQILLLLGGGISLGTVVRFSGLLDLLVSELSTISDNAYSMFLLFCFIVMVISDFISHTVTAITTLQVVGKVGAGLGTGHSQALIFGAVLCCSGAAALPVSGFPNVICYSIKDAKGRRILETKDYLVCGTVVQLALYGLVISIGWLIFKGFGF